MRPVARAVLVAALAVLLVGCGAEAEDSESAGGAELSSAQTQTQIEKQWRMDLSDELGFDGYDFDAAVAQALEDCERTKAGPWKVALALGGDLEGSGVTRIGLTYACPKVLPAFDAAYDEVSAAPDLTAYVCTLPTDAMTVAERSTLRVACAG